MSNDKLPVVLLGEMQYFEALIQMHFGATLHTVRNAGYMQEVWRDSIMIGKANPRQLVQIILKNSRIPVTQFEATWAVNQMRSGWKRFK